MVVKGASAIETLGQVRTVLFDKTGTFTVGTPEVRQIFPRPGFDSTEVLSLAASVDSMSAHVLGAALVQAASEEELRLEEPVQVGEDSGQGIAGTVRGRRVAIGSRRFLAEHGISPEELEAGAIVDGHGSGEARVLVGVDGVLAGVIVMGRRPAPRRSRHRRPPVGRERAAGRDGLRRPPLGCRAGRSRTGRRPRLQRAVSQDKLEVIRRLREDQARGSMMMVGEGVNDAPVLALARRWGRPAPRSPPKRPTR